LSQAVLTNKTLDRAGVSPVALCWRTQVFELIWA
jgi:hypothetical protein